jgi:hypothetical protein
MVRFLSEFCLVDHHLPSASKEGRHLMANRFGFLISNVACWTTLDTIKINFLVTHMAYSNNPILFDVLLSNEMINSNVDFYLLMIILTLIDLM